MTRRHPGRGGQDWERVRKFILKNATHCAICGQPLDFDAPPRSPGSPSVDHIIPISKTRDYDPITQRRMALDPSLLRAVHYGCNSRRGNRPAASRPQGPAAPIQRNSRTW